MPSRDWNPVAEWYTGWVGARGSKFHRRFAVPLLLDLLEPVRGEHMLDVGCGPGVLSPFIARAGARYTGVDASAKMLAFARRHHGAHGRFVRHDATRLTTCAAISVSSFDAVTFLLSIQDIDPLELALESAAWALVPNGRLVIVMTHPCFRVPRQSGWGWDAGRRLQFRRVDRYLTRLAVPMKSYDGARGGETRSYHRPLSAYVNALSAAGLLVDAVQEIPGPAPDLRAGRAGRMAAEEIPLFLGIRATRSTPRGPIRVDA
jgi:SAM-dependent methyltransferase